MQKNNGFFVPIKEKLRSDRGVSIFFALMLFFVCLTVSATVLAAAMASAGRASQIAKVDQRYYSVRSAADLFRDQFADGVAVSIERAKEEKTTRKYSVIVDTSNPEENARIRTLMSGYPQKSSDYSVKLNGEEVERDRSIFEDVALDLLFGFDRTDANYTKEDMYKRSTSDGITSDQSRTYTLRSSGSAGTDSEALDINVKTVIKPDGSIDIFFSSPSDGTSSSFTMKMVMTAHIKEEVNTEKTPETSTVEGDEITGYTDTVERVQKEIKTVTIEWECTDLIVVGKEG